MAIPQAYRNKSQRIRLVNHTVFSLGIHYNSNNLWTNQINIDFDALIIWKHRCCEGRIIRFETQLDGEGTEWAMFISLYLAWLIESAWLRFVYPPSSSAAVLLRLSQNVK